MSTEYLEKARSIISKENSLSAMTTEITRHQETTEDLITRFSTPGKSYFFILEFDSFEVLETDGLLEKHWGLEEGSFDMEKYFQRIHPEERQVFHIYYSAAFRFAKKHIPLEHIRKYKLQLHLRFKNEAGVYSRILEQALPIEFHSNGKMKSILIIHTDISHFNYPPGIYHAFTPIDYSLPTYTNILSQRSGVQITSYDFSAREVEILNLLADGVESKGISKRLSISETTVKTHRQNILKKTQAANMIEVISQSFRMGILR